MFKPLTALIVGLAGLVLFGLAANAGGESTVTLDEELGEIEAGDEIEVGFVVKQHGQDPVNEAFGESIEPIVIATNRDTGGQVKAEATQAGDVGHFVASLEFPTEGDWDIQITTMPLHNISNPERVNVAVADSGGFLGGVSILWAGVPLLAGGLALGAVAVRRARS